MNNRTRRLKLNLMTTTMTTTTTMTARLRACVLLHALFHVLLSSSSSSSCVFTAATSTVGAVANDNDNDNKKEPAIFRVLVIGGGISGMAATRHLMIKSKSKSNIRLEIDLLESKSRLGGRIWTVPTTNTTKSTKSSKISTHHHQQQQQQQQHNADLGGMYWHGVDSPLFQELQSQLLLAGHPDDSSHHRKWKTVATNGTSANPGKGGSKLVWWWGATIRKGTGTGTGTDTGTANDTTSTTTVPFQELDATVIHSLPELIGEWNTTMKQRIGAYLKEQEDQETRSSSPSPSSSPSKLQQEEQQGDHPARLLLLQQWSQEFISSLPTEQERRLLQFQLHMAFDLDFGLPMEQLAMEGLANGWDWKDSLGDDHISVEGMARLVSAMEQDIQKLSSSSSSSSSSSNNNNNNKVASNTARIHRGQRVTRIQYSTNEASTSTSSPSSSPSSSSSSSTSFCTVHTNDGREWTANACIVTLPIGVLKQHHQQLFDPPLEAAKQDALQRTGVGALNTVVVRWNRPICNDPDTTAYYFVADDDQDADDDDDTAAADSKQDKTYTTTSSTTSRSSRRGRPKKNLLSHGFVCSGRFQTGDPTVTQFHFAAEPKFRGNHHHQHNAKIQKYWRRQAVEVVQKVLLMRQQEASTSSNATTTTNNGGICGATTNNEHQEINDDGATAGVSSDTNCSATASSTRISEADIVDLLWSDWHADPDILGSYSAPTTYSHGNVDRQILAQSVGNSLFFAGEHTHTKGRYQSIDGAYETGVWAAEQVLEAIMLVHTD